MRTTELLGEELRHQRIDTPVNRSWMSAGLAARAVSRAAVARVIRFLAGPDAAPLSGARVPVDGDA